ncbi:hypothetical protein K6U06_09560 [Acidiferrimicrobium sp. IK]|uniref:hypothetical protein n=1 Tax=Acidiferrimicrobium sp. IK TaxID=2871700 RepID=UPI0021CB5F69|nr:hypothetical protein [Acidiferrimicrobium sp. IK]MCU4184604.1 hypothetical protein [Acidiferrimicrobium sp. IK]
MAQTTTYDDPVLDHDDQVLELHEAPARPSPRMTSWAGRRLKGVLHAAVIAILLAAVAFLGLRVQDSRHVGMIVAGQRR